MTLTLKAAKRSVTGKGVQALRREGRIPAVVYGKDFESLPIDIGVKDFSHVFMEAGESTVIALDIDGEAKNVLIHDVDVDPVTNVPRHADFYAVRKGQKVTVEVPIVFTGEAPAVKELGANLIKVLYDIEVKAEADNLPHEVSVDVSNLATLEDNITAANITLPAGAELITDPAETVVILRMPEEEPEEPTEEPDMESIGLSEERGKKEEDEAGDTEQESGDKKEEEKTGE
ncbi:MAG: 50S ribosomal protein L25 [Candidatus Paceibacteria bacterium]